MSLFYLYLIMINIVAVVVTCYDKYCAVKHKWRIKEKSLLLVSLLGGSVGMYITMQIIRHKTKHPKFMIGIPVIFIVQLIAFFWG